MKIFRRIISFFAPDICLGCGYEGAAICDECLSMLSFPAQCVLCKRPSLGGLTCDKCGSKSSVDALYASTEYIGLGKSAISHMKYRPSSDTAEYLGRYMASKLPYLLSSQTIVSYVPTTPSRVRERGFDQAKIMAKLLSKESKLPFCPTLARLSNSHQVGSSRKERIEHMKKAFYVNRSYLVKDKTVVLVDDVLTTGATIESASKELKKAGAKRVLVAVFARA